MYTTEKPDYIPPEILRLEAPGDTTFIPPRRRQMRHRERRQKWGKMSSLHIRLRARPHQPALLSLSLANCWSLINKIDKIRLRITSHNMGSCVTVFTETWQDSNIPHRTIELAGHIAYQANRSACSNKGRGGGVCIYVNNNWYTEVDITGIQYLVVKYRPFYLPREFSAILITVAYIPPHTKAGGTVLFY